MSYLLTGFLARHFRATENRWQTRAEIAAASNKTAKTFTQTLSKGVQNGLLETRGSACRMRYRFRGDALYEERVAPGKKTVSQVTREFCNRWKVEVPSDATQHNPRAFDEWLQVMAERV